MNKIIVSPCHEKFGCPNCYEDKNICSKTCVFLKLYRKHLASCCYAETSAVQDNCITLGFDLPVAETKYNSDDYSSIVAVELIALRQLKAEEDTVTQYVEDTFHAAQDFYKGWSTAVDA